MFDLHNDLLSESISEKQLEEIVKKVKKSGYSTVYAIFNENGSIVEAVAKAKKALTCGARYIAFENCCFIGDGSSNYYEKPTDCLSETCEKILSLKPLYASLTWNGENAFACGCSGVGGLKSRGEEFIIRLNQHKIALDTAHLNEQSFFAAVELSEKVLCSHTAFDFVYPHRRNLTDGQIKTILNNNGIVGITAVGHFLTANKNEYESAFYEHIAGYFKKFGGEGLAVGTDFFGTDAPVFPHGDYSFAEDFWDKLGDMGISESKIEAVLYKNAEKFFGL